MDEQRGLLLTETLSDVIKKYREEASKLEPKEREHLQKISTLEAPTQIIAFDFVRPERQVFLIVHSTEAEDGLIRVHEGIQPWTAQQILEQELEDPLWDGPLGESDGLFIRPPRPDMSLRSLAVDVFLMINNNLGAYLRQKPRNEPSNSLSKQFHDYTLSTWEHTGPGSAIDWDEQIRGDMDGARSNAERYATEESEDSTESTDDLPVHPTDEERYDGRGAFHLPAMRIGTLPSPRLSAEQIASHHIPGITVYRTKVGPHDLVVTHNAFFGLLTKDTESALHWLNLMMLALRKHGYPSQAVRHSDLAKFHPPDQDPFAFWGGIWPVGNPNQDRVWSMHWISVDQLEECLVTAKRLSEHPAANQLHWLLEAETHIYGEETAQSLIFSWAIIERVMSDRWDSYLREQNVKGQRRRNLRKSMEWPLHSRIEAMNLGGALDQRIYDALMDVKTTRNRTMHGSDFPTVDEAKRALMLAQQLLLGDDHILVPPINLFSDL